MRACLWRQNRLQAQCRRHARGGTRACESHHPTASIPWGSRGPIEAADWCLPTGVWLVVSNQRRGLSKRSSGALRHPTSISSCPKFVHQLFAVDTRAGQEVEVSSEILGAVSRHFGMRARKLQRMAWRRRGRSSDSRLRARAIARRWSARPHRQRGVERHVGHCITADAG